MEDTNVNKHGPTCRGERHLGADSLDVWGSCPGEDVHGIKATTEDPVFVNIRSAEHTALEMYLDKQTSSLRDKEEVTSDLESDNSALEEILSLDADGPVLAQTRNASDPTQQGAAIVNGRDEVSEGDQCVKGSAETEETVSDTETHSKHHWNLPTKGSNQERIWESVEDTQPALRAQHQDTASPTNRVVEPHELSDDDDVGSIWLHSTRRSPTTNDTEQFDTEQTCLGERDDQSELEKEDAESDCNEAGDIICPETESTRNTSDGTAPGYAIAIAPASASATPKTRSDVKDSKHLSNILANRTTPDNAEVSLEDAKLELSEEPQRTRLPLPSSLPDSAVATVVEQREVEPPPAPSYAETAETSETELSETHGMESLWLDGNRRRQKEQGHLHSIAKQPQKLGEEALTYHEERRLKEGSENTGWLNDVDHPSVNWQDQADITSELDNADFESDSYDVEELLSFDTISNCPEPAQARNSSGVAAHEHSIANDKMEVSEGEKTSEGASDTPKTRSDIVKDSKHQSSTLANRITPGNTETSLEDAKLEVTVEPQSMLLPLPFSLSDSPVAAAVEQREMEPPPAPPYAETIETNRRGHEEQGDLHSIAKQLQKPGEDAPTCRRVRRLKLGSENTGWAHHVDHRSVNWQDQADITSELDNADFESDSYDVEELLSFETISSGPESAPARNRSGVAAHKHAIANNNMEVTEEEKNWEDASTSKHQLNALPPCNIATSLDDANVELSAEPHNIGLPLPSAVPASPVVTAVEQRETESAPAPADVESRETNETELSDNDGIGSFWLGGIRRRQEEQGQRHEITKQSQKPSAEQLTYHDERGLKLVSENTGLVRDVDHRSVNWRDEADGSSELEEGAFESDHTDIEETLSFEADSNGPEPAQTQDTSDITAQEYPVVNNMELSEGEKSFAQLEMDLDKQAESGRDNEDVEQGSEQSNFESDSSEVQELLSLNTDSNRPDAAKTQNTSIVTDQEEATVNTHIAVSAEENSFKGFSAIADTGLDTVKDSRRVSSTVASISAPENTPPSLENAQQAVRAEPQDGQVALAAPAGILVEQPEIESEIGTTFSDHRTKNETELSDDNDIGSFWLGGTSRRQATLGHVHSLTKETPKVNAEVSIYNEQCELSPCRTTKNSGWGMALHNQPASWRDKADVNSATKEADVESESSEVEEILNLETDSNGPDAAETCEVTAHESESCNGSSEITGEKSTEETGPDTVEADKHQTNVVDNRSIPEHREATLEDSQQALSAEAQEVRRQRHSTLCASEPDTVEGPPNIKQEIGTAYIKTREANETSSQLSSDEEDCDCSGHKARSPSSTHGMCCDPNDKASQRRTRPNPIDVMGASNDPLNTSFEHVLPGQHCGCMSCHRAP
eukprot:GHVQ01016724.1.p1 GENE.GHVQ01016724.1~~GHVQ01016724.1.p1  ORF type:complete len:1556 (-),score=280.47 GHVQ01016724.1:3736-7875(-)